MAEETKPDLPKRAEEKYSRGRDKKKKCIWQQQIPINYYRFEVWVEGKWLGWEGEGEKEI